MAVAAGSVDHLLPTLSPQLRTPIEHLLQAQADEHRAAALEQLRYQAPSLEVVGQLMPLVLADDAESVRERAISLLVACGVRGTVVDLVRALQHQDDKQLQRLAPALTQLPRNQRQLALDAVIAAVGRGWIAAGMLHVAQALADCLIDHPSLGRLIEWLLPHAERLSIVALIRSLQRLDAAAMDHLLDGLLGHSQVADAHLIVLLARPDAPQRDDLLERGLDIILSQQAEPRDRLALAAALRRLNHGDHLAQLLVERRAALALCRDTAIFWLIAEVCREQHDASQHHHPHARHISQAQGDALLLTLTEMLREPRGTHVITILEQQIPALLPASSEARQEHVSVLGDLLGRFRDQRSRDLTLTVMSQMAPEAIQPLWFIIQDHPQRLVRELCLKLLPGMLLRDTESHDSDESSSERENDGSSLANFAEAEPIISTLSSLLDVVQQTNDQQEKAIMLAVAAELAQAPALSSLQTTSGADCLDEASVSQEMLSEGAAWSARVDKAIDHHHVSMIPALGHIAAGPHCGLDRRAEILEWLLLGISAELPESEEQVTVDPHSDEITYHLDDQLGAHTDAVPDMLRALERIGRSPHLPAPLLRRLVGGLVKQWQRVASWQVIWGPGNIQELGRVLGHIGSPHHFPPALRLQIAEQLLPKVSQLGICRSLVRMLHHAEGERGLSLCQRLGRRLIQLVSDGQFADDESSDLAGVLVMALSLPLLNQEDSSIARRLAGLLSNYRDQLNPRDQTWLADHLEDLEPSVRMRVM